MTFSHGACCPSAHDELYVDEYTLFINFLLFFERNDTQQNDAMNIDLATQEEINRLDQAVDDFASEMKARLREQAIKGYRGWDDPVNYERIAEMMVNHAAVHEGEEVDAANLAMILWSLRRR